MVEFFNVLFMVFSSKLWFEPGSNPVRTNAYPLLFNIKNYDQVVMKNIFKPLLY